MKKNNMNTTGGNAALLNDYHRKSDSLAQWKINFLPDTATQIYGFDYLGSGNHGIYSGSEYYPYLNSNYDLRYKSVECGKTDKVIVDFGSYLEADSVIFKDKYGVTLKLSKGNVLNFTGENQAVACYTIKDKLSCCCNANYVDNTGWLHGVTYTNEKGNDRPIWLDPSGRNPNEYYFLVSILFHEISHRISYRGSLIMDQKYFNHKAICPSGDDGHDESGLVFGGDNNPNKALPVSALKTKGIFYISINLRRYVMYNYLFHNLKQYNNK